MPLSTGTRLGRYEVLAVKVLDCGLAKAVASDIDTDLAKIKI